MIINKNLLIKLALLLFIITIANSCDEPYTGEPKNTITVKKATELSTNFNTRHKIISDLIGKPDNRSSWHSLAELKQYIAYIEKEGATKDLDIDGIRIYFGAYNEKEGNYSTLFLVPTVQAKTTDKSNGAVKSFMAIENMSEDTKSIKPLNFGGLGKPPSREF